VGEVQELDTGKTLIFDGVSWQEYKQPAFYVEPTS